MLLTVTPIAALPGLMPPSPDGGAAGDGFAPLLAALGDSDAMRPVCTLLPPTGQDMPVAIREGSKLPVAILLPDATPADALAAGDAPQAAPVPAPVVSPARFAPVIPAAADAVTTESASHTPLAASPLTARQDRPLAPATPSSNLRTALLTTVAALAAETQPPTADPAPAPASDTPPQPVPAPSSRLERIRAAAPRQRGPTTNAEPPVAKLERSTAAVAEPQVDAIWTAIETIDQLPSAADEPKAQTLADEPVTLAAPSEERALTPGNVIVAPVALTTEQLPREPKTSTAANKSGKVAGPIEVRAPRPAAVNVGPEINTAEPPQHQPISTARVAAALTLLRHPGLEPGSRFSPAIDVAGAAGSPALPDSSHSLSPMIETQPVQPAATSAMPDFPEQGSGTPAQGRGDGGSLLAAKSATLASAAIASAGPISSPAIAPVSIAPVALTSVAAAPKGRTPSGARGAMQPTIVATPAPALGRAPPAILPALQAFGAAMRQALADERRPAPPEGDIALLAPAPLTAAAPLPAAATATLDTADQRWPQAMAEHIERLRDAANEQSTRIRLLPDALGPVDIAVRREGELVHVHFTAAEAQTRQLLQDAQPRLAEAADARGLKLGRAEVGGGDTPAGEHRQRPPAQPSQPSRPAPASTAGADPADTRIA